MPRPKNQKEVKQFLGLIGYYRKFVPRFADISRVLNKLTHKDEEFEWTAECDKCFNMLKDYLQEAPILRYPDPEARYVLYTDASKYAYAGVLTQTTDGTDHPIAYVSGLFKGITTKLGSSDKGSIRNLHVSKEIELLLRFSKDHSEERPPATKEILGEKYHERKGKQLGSRA